MPETRGSDMPNEPGTPPATSDPKEDASAAPEREASLSSESQTHERSSGEPLSPSFRVSTSEEERLPESDPSPSGAEGSVPTKLRVGDILRTYDIVTEAQIAEAVDYGKTHGIRIGEALVELGFTNQDQINWAVAQHLGIPYVEVKLEMLDPALIRSFPYEDLLFYRMLPIVATRDSISVALADPTTQEGIEALLPDERRQIQIAIAREGDIVALLHSVFGRPFSGEGSEGKRSQRRRVRLEDLVSRHLPPEGGELFLDPIEGGYLLRGRRHGHTFEIERLSTAPARNLLRQLRAVAGVPVEVKTPSYHRGSLEVAGERLPLHVAATPFLEGPAFRIQIGGRPLHIEKGLERGEEYEELREFLEKRYGMILVVSPELETRHGILEGLIAPFCERGGRGFLFSESMELPGFLRISPRADPASFVLTQAPDLLVSDPLDLFAVDRFRSLLQIALSHPVFVGSSLRSAEEAIALFLEQGIPATLLESAIHAVLAGVCVHPLCPACKGEGEEIPEHLRIRFALPHRDTVASGCPACGQSGYAPPRLVLDFVPCRNDFIAAVRKGAAEAPVRTRYPTLRERLLALTREGVLSLSELLRLVRL
ncbi:MAG: hypothetical protein D6812_05980 [Deltaproteobacteria bacterium]|nr:MAG: hypothetical protein D6812_05980 [Deltaproteobacteria bacterium]